MAGIMACRAAISKSVGACASVVDSVIWVTAVEAASAGAGVIFCFRREIVLPLPLCLWYKAAGLVFGVMCSFPCGIADNKPVHSP